LATAVCDEAGLTRAGDQPIEKHPDRGELLLHRRPGKFFAKFFDIGGDMHRTDPLELQASGFARRSRTAFRPALAHR
jgi:hypothetical protein